MNGMRIIVFLFTLGISSNAVWGQNTFCTMETDVYADSTEMVISNESILSSIKDTLNQIALQTAPKRFLFWESTRTGNWIGFLAMIAGVVAGIFAWRGYVYQRKSANSLKQMENKRLPFMTFAKLIFERVLTLDILIDIEETEDTDKEKRRVGYQIDKAIDGLLMPDDLIDIRCYEKFKDDAIYSTAIKLKVSWKNYNKDVRNLAECFEKGDFNNIVNLYYSLKRRTISLQQEFFDFENLINGISETSFKPKRFRDVFIRLSKKYKKNNSASKFIDAKKTFLIQLLIDSLEEVGFEKIRENRNLINESNLNIEKEVSIPWVADSKIFKYDISLFGFEMDLPLSKRVCKMMKKTRSLNEDLFNDNSGKVNLKMKLKYFLWSVFLEKILLRKLPKQVFELYCAFLSSQNTKLKWANECYFNRIFDSAWRSYIERMETGESSRNMLLVHLIYNLEIALKRNEMIDDPVFLKNESWYFSKEYHRYYSVPIPVGTHKNLTFEDFIYAVVAEQNYSFDAGELNVWKYKYPIEASLYKPVLEFMEVIKDGKFTVKTMTGLREIMQKYPKELFDYPIESSDGLKRILNMVGSQCNADEQYKISMMYKTGDGVPSDHSEAIFWVRKAAEQGSAEAQTVVGYLYEYGKGVERDYAEAERWYLKASEQGFSEAQGHLGDIYKKGGLGVNQDYAKSVRWYCKAAENGNIQAQYCLGSLYKEGLVVPQDYEQAARWYLKAAEGGHFSAQYEIAYMYQFGQGLEKSDSDAIYWYRKAAENGHHIAYQTLRLLGQNVELP